LIVDPEKESIEIYSLQDAKYILQEFLQEEPFHFTLPDECKIEVTLKNIWE
jgi:hypothetical protein